MYALEFVKNIFTRKNFGSLIYILLTASLVVLFFTYVGSDHLLGAATGLVVYMIVFVISLSPLGEVYLRTTSECRRIEDPKLLSRLEPLFFEVKERAQQKHPDLKIHDNVRLYIKQDDDPNAFALGRKTVCVTTGLLRYSNEEIKAILGHEFGHLATHDTDLLLLINTSNLFISVPLQVIRIVLFVIKAMAQFITIIAGEWLAVIFNIMVKIYTFFAEICLNGIVYLWTKFSLLLTQHSSRNAEYVADAFSCDLGYTDGMLSFFNKLIAMEGMTIKKRFDVFDALMRSHPDTQKRIDRIVERTGTAV